MKTITLLIHPDGGLELEASGYHGPDCEAATAFLEEALGKVKERRRKPEHHHRRQHRRQRLKVAS